MPSDLQNLRIDRSARRAPNSSPQWRKWAVAALVALALLGMAGYGYSKLNAPVEVQVVRVASTASAAEAEPGTILNATGYIVAAHKIEVGSKVVGRVAWIGVDKGDRVKQGQVIVRLEDEEYRAQLEQARGQLATLEARLRELEAGSRPEEIAEARANLEQAKADLQNARVNLDRSQQLRSQAVVSQQVLDDAKARYDAAAARVNSLEKRFDLVRIGPRIEQVDAGRGQVIQARGAVDFARTQVENTVIRAPVTGTILERAVEKGEFVTTSFVGERGAKGYVVSLADLNDLEVELDISQSDFAKLGPQQRGWVTTDAYPDRRYAGYIRQISPEANRQKATVQVKVKVENPDGYLRPDMNASVAFYNPEKPVAGQAAKRAVSIPAGAIRDGAVFVLLGDKAVRRAVRTAGTTSQGVRVEEGLIGGEDLIVNPPTGLKPGDRVRAKKG
jgi:HlyD family secretion protein